MDKIAVLIPCYNECKTIKKVIEDWKIELPEATIYVYDNNSTDGTVEIAQSVNTDLGGGGGKSDMNIGREKGTSYDGCSGRLMLNVILW